MRKIIYKIHLFILVFVCCSLGLSAQYEPLSATDLLYMEFANNRIELGMLGKSRGFIEEHIFLKRYELQTLSKEVDTFTLDAVFMQTIQQAVAQDKKILLYGHSWLGEVEPYFSPSVKSIVQEVLPDTNWLVLVLLRPTSFVGYLRNYEGAYSSGTKAARFMAPIMDLLQHHRNKTYFLAHSMGNKFLEGLCSQWEGGKPLFRHLIMAAPDLDIEVPATFESKKLASEMTVYTHTQDRMLYLAEHFHNKPRLGNQELYSLVSDSSMVQYVDVTRVCFLGERLDLSNHVYFISSRGVRSDIRALLNDEKHPKGRHRIGPSSYHLRPDIVTY